MTALLWLKDNWRLILFAAILGALGVQSYRLLGTQSAYASYKAEQEAQSKERETETARYAAFDKFNKRKSDEAYRVAIARIPAHGVRSDPDFQAVPTAPASGGGDESTYCGTGDDIDRELSGFARRDAERLSSLAEASAKVAAAYESCKSYAESLDALQPGGPAPAPRPESGPPTGVDVVGATAQLPL